jgi:hypothetical protein
VPAVPDAGPGGPRIAGGRLFTAAPIALARPTAADSIIVGKYAIDVPQQNDAKTKAEVAVGLSNPEILEETIDFAYHPPYEGRGAHNSLYDVNVLLENLAGRYSGPATVGYVADVNTGTHEDIPELGYGKRAPVDTWEGVGLAGGLAAVDPQIPGLAFRMFNAASSVNPVPMYSGNFPLNYSLVPDQGEYIVIGSNARYLPDDDQVPWSGFEIPQLMNEKPWLQPGNNAGVFSAVGLGSFNTDDHAY